MSEAIMTSIQLSSTPVADAVKAIQSSRSTALTISLDVQEFHAKGQLNEAAEASHKVSFISRNRTLVKDLLSTANLNSSIKILLSGVFHWQEISIPVDQADLIRIELLKDEANINTKSELYVKIMKLLVEQTFERPLEFEYRLNHDEVLKQDGDIILADHPQVLSPFDARGLGGIALQQFARLVERSADAAGLTDLRRICYLSGIYLWHGLPEESHRYSQSIEGKGVPKTGDYWHAIMHRMEPDYFNSKYWNRRVGRHPVHEQLYNILSSELVCNSKFYAETDAEKLISRGAWQGDLLVDLCEQAARLKDAKLIHQLMQIQELEMLLLLLYSVSDDNS